MPLAAAVELPCASAQREIIKSPAKLKEKQRALRQQIGNLQAATQRQIDEGRLPHSKQIDDLKTSNPQQFNMLQQQFEVLRSTLWLFITIVLVILGAMSKILWEHQKQLTALQVLQTPLKTR